MSGRPDGGGPAVDAAGDFGGFDGRTWLNCAHQGPLPLVAVAAAERALADKAAPHRMGDEAFAEVPRRLKDVLGRLVGVPAEEVILGNSTTYGLQLLVQGVDWRDGDEDRARRFRASSEMVLWTPGKESGNPLTLQPLPMLWQCPLPPQVGQVQPQAILDWGFGRAAGWTYSTS